MRNLLYKYIKKSIRIVLILFSISTFSFAQNNDFIIVEKLTNAYSIDSSTFSKNIDSNFTPIPLSEIPMTRDSSSCVINKEYGIIDYTFSGYEDSFIFFLNPQILEIRHNKFNIDSLLFVKNKYKIEYDFTQADLYRIKSGTKELILLNAPERYFFHCIDCSSQLLLVIDITSFTPTIKTFVYACKNNPCGILNLETVKSDKYLKILAKNTFNKYEIFKIDLSQ